MLLPYSVREWGESRHNRYPENVFDDSRLCESSVYNDREVWGSSALLVYRTLELGGSRKLSTNTTAILKGTVNSDGFRKLRQGCKN